MSTSDPAARAGAERKDLGDYRNILSGTSQNIIGLVIAGVAQFVANVLISRTLGESPFGVVTVLTQAMFVLSFATRFGMDMAVLRDVAIDVGAGRFDRIRTHVSRATWIALGVSSFIALLLVVFSNAFLDLFSVSFEFRPGLAVAAAVALPGLALTNVWLSATRGLKIMRYTLYLFWAGQPVLWIVFMLGLWRVEQSARMAVLAYSLSWLVVALPSWWFWRKESRGWERAPLERGAMAALLRYAGPRAPAALFTQLLFWTDLFVLTRYAVDSEVGVYSAALRSGQVLLLLLTSVALMFSPFVADLHNRGETQRLDGLYKTLTRWTLVATMPVFLLLAVAPGEVLEIFGADFAGGETALLLLILGQFINVATGSVGFVLIMVGRTGWDLVVQAGSLALNLGLAFWLAPRYGMEGAAIANAATFAASKWWRLALVRKFVGIWPYDRQYLRLIVPTLLGGAVMWLVHSVITAGYLIDLVLSGLLGTGAFALAYLVFGLAPAEKRELGRLVAKLRKGQARSA
ncbi:MAG: oligosaccharide flippase family protein [Actinomycetota bacterium]